ncbi:hypothetical protein [Paenibacillus gansuensis]|uniref:HicB-like antitoxin of toxin-antitoxin system domain-containing protein n=1 Tax=Paenibacillus gansuensis TaxID=306542 RepID=A0ABW5PKY9_9BACL
MNNQYIVIYESDASAANVAAYIPAFKESIIGDTIDEARELCIDILNLQCDSYLRKGFPLPKETATIEYIELEDMNYAVLYENFPNGEKVAYIPSFRSNIIGKDLETLRIDVQQILLSEINTLKRNGKQIPVERTIVGYLSNYNFLLPQAL